MRRVALLASIVIFLSGSLAAEIGSEAIELRNRGVAELENEQPAKAEEIFEQLTKLMPKDPLPYANLAIATLRQQKFEDAETWIERALRLSPQAPDLLAIKAEVMQWSGRSREALEVWEQAAEADPENVQVQYGLYRQATTGGDAGGEEAAARVLDRLARLRPENLVVMLQLGQRAVQAGDAAAATQAFLRIQELAWQAPPAAATLLDGILQSLEAGDFEKARVPALRMENVFKITPMFREGLRELSIGVQGNPIFRFRQESPPDAFGEPRPVSFRASRVSPPGSRGISVAAGDFDGDQRSDLASITAADTAQLHVRCGQDGSVSVDLPAPEITRLLATDLNNDGSLDLMGFGPNRIILWQGAGDCSFEDRSDAFGLAETGAVAATVIDFDIEGDLDLALAGGRSGVVEIFRNSLQGPLERVGERTLPEVQTGEIRDLLTTDLDRDGDLDLVLLHEDGIIWLDNLRQGKFVDGTERAGLAGVAGGNALDCADLDNDGWPDLVIAGEGIRFLHNDTGRFSPWDLGKSLRTNAEFAELEIFEADNDGRLDVAVAGALGFTILAQREGGRFEFTPLAGAPAGAIQLAAADVDADGDLDLLSAGEQGVHLLENLGGNQNRWLTVRLRGLDKGNGKNNLFGLGSTLELFSGKAYQFREADSDSVHFGLGDQPAAEVLRVVWTNGVPQNRLDTQAQQWVVEEQVLKGSCPFLYAWNGEEFQFVTDLLWGAPAGLPAAPGVWVGSDPDELVKVEGLKPRAGVYDLRVTEELWEAAFFDHVRLWIVDHPRDVEVASNLRIVPGGDPMPLRLLASPDVRSVAMATDGRGLDVTPRIRTRDDIYAGGWSRSRYQGVAAEPWTFTLDLGEAPGVPIRLFMDGWIFPTDASLNLALAQRADLNLDPPRLEVETDKGWEILMANMGHPAGKTKTMVLETPPLPAGARRLRIVSSQWISWDRIGWSEKLGDDLAVVRERILPSVAELRSRGFSAPARLAPNAPHSFDYAQVTRRSPWEPFPGNYTRYGDVRELLATPDDRSAILGPGDEIALQFDASALPPTPEGWTRTVFLESHGWDKDADRNTWEPDHLEPLPFRAMSGYPYGSEEAFPDTQLHREYREKWLTRLVPPTTPGERPVGTGSAP